MPTAQIITIGTELLLGIIPDTNTAFIAQTLNQHGIDLYKTLTIGDNEARIAAEICSALQQADILITTGGLGPTVDDPTRAAVARAFGVQLAFQPHLWDQIQQRFQAWGRQPSENNRRQAFLPQGAQGIENPVGTAPAFYVQRKGKIVVCLPGVPPEMKTLLLDAVMPLLQRVYRLSGITLSRTLHTAGMGESNVDELIAEFEQLSNPTVGLSAHPGQVDIRITAKTDTPQQAQALIAPLERQIRALLGVKIFGVDSETLPQVLTQLADSQNVRLDLFHTPSAAQAAADLAQFPMFQLQPALPREVSLDEFQADSLYNEDSQHDFLVLSEGLNDGRRAIHMLLRLDGETIRLTRGFGGHPALYPLWTRNHVLAFVRESIIKVKGHACKQ